MNIKRIKTVLHFVRSKILASFMVLAILTAALVSSAVHAQTSTINYPDLQRTNCDELNEFYDSLEFLDVYFLLFHYWGLLSHDHCEFNSSNNYQPPSGIGLGDAPPENFVGGGEVVFYHNDHLGSPIAATDAYGELLWTEEYQPYGEKYYAVDHPNTVGYTGHQHDESTGLTYMQARYYDPVVGRFMGVDPVGFMESNPMMFNRYAYGNNNPYRFVDPDGNVPLLVVIPLVAGAGLFSDYANTPTNGTDVYAKGAIEMTMAVAGPPGGTYIAGKIGGMLFSRFVARAADDAVETVVNKVTDKFAKKIFGKREGHLPDTPENRKLLQDVANDSKTTLGLDKHGNEWSSKIMDDGSQVWTQTRNGNVINGGLNKTPKTYNSETGLSATERPNWK